MKPSLMLLKPATEYAEITAKSIDARRFASGDIYQRVYQAWMSVADSLFENMQIPMSASGNLEDILDCLQPNRRKMRVEQIQGGYSIGYKSGGDTAILTTLPNGGMNLTFRPYGQKEEYSTTYDISCYGPDSVAAVIAALFKANRILEYKFQRYLYR